VSRFISLLSLCLVPLCASAQESTSDTTPFHGGQWAMQFGGSADLVSLGVLRFTSPRGAWLLDVSSDATVLDAKQTNTLSATTYSADRQFLSVNVRLGRRFYQVPRRRVLSFETVAVEGGLSDQMVDFAGSNLRQTNTNFGVHGEVGGAYMLTGGVSLGGTAGISVGRFKFKAHDSVSTTDGNGWYVDGIRVLFALGLYF